MPALAGALTRIKRRENGLHRRHAGADIAHGNADPGLARGIAGDLRQTALRLHQQVIGLHVAERSCLAIARDRTGDEARISLAQILRCEAEARDGAGRQILNEDIGLGDHAAQDGLVALLRQIETDRLLAAIEPDEISALSVDVVIVATGEITLRPFHLDHPRAGICQFFRCIGRRHRLFNGHHQNAVEIPCRSLCYVLGHVRSLLPSFFYERRHRRKQAGLRNFMGRAPSAAPKDRRRGETRSAPGAGRAAVRRHERSRRHVAVSLARHRPRPATRDARHR